jgi:mannose-1-phosphate guanylyltransferase
MGQRNGPYGQWAMLLAGGEGLRLRALTTRIAGDHRPKQFCPVHDATTPFEQTQRRAGRCAPAEHTVAVLTRAHERFYVPLVTATPAVRLVVQPEGRGTAPAILYGLLRIATVDPLGVVAVLPSDHYVSDDEAFMRHVDTAFDAVDRRPDVIALLGIEPDEPEIDYGWIEPGEPLGVGGLRRVRRFWEKPSQAVARHLMATGCLWNSFIIVTRLPALLGLIRRTLPDLYAAFTAIRPTLGTAEERSAVERVYRELPSLNFSEQVLAGNPANLAVLPVAGVDWSDWGRPERVLKTLAHLGTAPVWAVAPPGKPA